MLPEACEDIATQFINVRQQGRMEGHRDELHTLTSSFNTKQNYVCEKIFHAILPGVLSSDTIDTLPSASLNTYQSHIPIACSCTSHTSFNPILSLLPIPFLLLGLAFSS